MSFRTNILNIVVSLRQITELKQNSNMNKFFITLCAVLLPLCANAQIDELFDKPDAKKENTRMSIEEIKSSMVSLPTENGKVVFRIACDAPNAGKNELYSLLAYWAEKRFEPENKRATWGEKNFFKNLPYSRVRQASKSEGFIKCQGAEDIIVTNKFLVKNWAELYYTLTLTVTDNHVEAVVANIYYITDAEGDRTKFTAEEFISDESIEKAGGRFIRNAAKYRAETVKMFDQLLSEIKVVANSKKK